MSDIRESNAQLELFRPEDIQAPLHYIIPDGDMNAVKRHVRSGASINQILPNKGTPLIVAALYNKADIVEYLLAMKAEVGSQSNNKSALHYAAQNGNVEITRMLLDAGADSKVMDENGMTPFQLAVMDNQNEVCRLLGKNDSERTMEQETRLIYETIIRDWVWYNQSSRVRVRHLDLDRKGPDTALLEALADLKMDFRGMPDEVSRLMNDKNKVPFAEQVIDSAVMPTDSRLALSVTIEDWMSETEVRVTYNHCVFLPGDGRFSAIMRKRYGEWFIQDVAI